MYIPIMSSFTKRQDYHSYSTRNYSAYTPTVLRPAMSLTWTYPTLG